MSTDRRIRYVSRAKKWRENIVDFWNQEPHPHHQFNYEPGRMEWHGAGGLDYMHADVFAATFFEVEPGTCVPWPGDGK